jgi:hypothetical protein
MKNWILKQSVKHRSKTNLISRPVLTIHFNSVTLLKYLPTAENMWQAVNNIYKRNEDEIKLQRNNQSKHLPYADVSPLFLLSFS